MVRLRLSDDREWASAPFDAKDAATLVRGLSAARLEADAAGHARTTPLSVQLWDGWAWVTAEPGGYMRRLSVRDPDLVWLPEWRETWARIAEAHADYTEHAASVRGLAAWAGDTVTEGD